MSNTATEVIENIEAAPVAAAVELRPPVSTVVNTKEFRTELEWVARFIPKKSTIPILQNVQMLGTEFGLVLTGTDLETAGVSSVESAGAPVSLAVTVPAAQLLKYLKKVTESRVELIADGTKLTVRHDDAECTLEGMSPESFPELPRMPGECFELSGLDKAIPRILPAISADESRFTLNGALLEVKATYANLISTDGHRLSIHPLEFRTGDLSQYGDKRILIPKFALAEVARAFGDSAVCATDENHVFFTRGQRTILSRKLTVSFPDDWERVIPSDALQPLHCATIDTAALRKHGERVALFADERSRAVRFTLADNKLVVSAETCDNGKARGVIATTWERPEWMSGFNWEYILDFLKLAPATAFDLLFHEARAKETELQRDASDAIVQNRDAVILQADGWRYVVMPMRF